MEREEAWSSAVERERRVVQWRGEAGSAVERERRVVQWRGRGG